MSALENAKNLGKDEIMQKITAAGLREFGVYNQNLGEKLNRELLEAGQQLGVIAAINNNDIVHARLPQLKTETEDILAGMQMVALCLNAQKIQLYIPEGQEELKKYLETAAQDTGIEICEGIVDVRATRGSSINHIQTMAAVGALFGNNDTPGTWMNVCQADTLGEPVKVAFGTKISEIPGIDSEGVKGFLLGSKLYDATGLDLVIEADTNIGNGVITLFCDNCCIIDEAKKLLLKERAAGCGKCTFCREGLGQLHAMTREITEGKGKAEYLEMLSEIGNAMTFSCLCSLGQTGADFTLGTLQIFGEDYTEHIKKKRCPQNVCSAFMNIYIDPNLCEGCEECADVCPADCIEGKNGFIHMIDEFDCTKCGKCIDACDYDAVIKTTGRMPKLPTRLTKCGKFKKR